MKKPVIIVKSVCTWYQTGGFKCQNVMHLQRTTVQHANLDRDEGCMVPDCWSVGCGDTAFLQPVIKLLLVF